MGYSRTLPFAIAFTLSLFAADLEAEFRTWNDSTGNYSVEAEYVRADGDKVVLKKRDGSTVKVPFAKLSHEDNTYVVSQDPAAAIHALETLARSFYSFIFDQMRTASGRGTKAYLRAEKLSSMAPSSMQSALAVLIITTVTPFVFLFFYIWLLKHEFRASPWWGVSQLVADLAVTFLLPYVGLAVALFFGLKHSDTSKGPVIAYVILSLITFGSFFLIPKDVFQ